MADPTPSRGVDPRLPIPEWPIELLAERLYREDALRNTWITRWPELPERFKSSYRQKAARDDLS